MITAKLIFVQVCEKEVKWDESLPSPLKQQWAKFTQGLCELGSTITVPRTVSVKGGTFSLHGFADASASAVCAVIYAVENKNGHFINSQLLVAKSRIAPKGQSISRLELVACHVLAKLMKNVKESLDVPIG